MLRHLRVTCVEFGSSTRDNSKLCCRPLDARNMDITFYILIALASAVLLLAMWACSSHSVPHWGPDLTLELPPHILQEVFFQKPTSTKYTVAEAVPSAPSETDGTPLLTSAKPQIRPKCPPKPPPKPIIMKSQVVRVLPPQFVQEHGLRSTTHCFIAKKPV